jgi:2-oxoglutarate ferredoxin oxidoreductase subunit delta
MKEKTLKLSYEKPEGSWEIYPEICKSCGICIAKCPVKALSFDEENSSYLGTPTIKCDITRCISCGTCVEVCPDCAIKVEKKK